MMLLDECFSDSVKRICGADANSQLVEGVEVARIKDSVVVLEKNLSNIPDLRCRCSLPKYGNEALVAIFHAKFGRIK